MTDFQPIATAPLDRPLMLVGKAMTKGVWHPALQCWTYATDDPDYCTPLNFIPDAWRELVGDERDGVSFDPPSPPDPPREPED